MNEFRKFVPLVKVEEQANGDLYVYGLVTAEKVDRDGEVCHYDTTVPFYKAVNDEFEKATSDAGIEKSIMPLREMHQLSAIGAGKAIDFNDAEKTIRMGFAVVDGEAKKKVRKGVYTGFSQGGKYVRKWDRDGKTFYTASPTEVSLVDNPCLASAHFEYVKADGTSEVRKFMETPVVERIASLRKALDLIKAEESSIEASIKEMTNGQPYVAGQADDSKQDPDLNKDKKTKSVSGENLTSSAFAYVGDPEKTETWKLPIHFSSDAKSKSHIRNALARFSQTEGIPSGERSKVLGRIKAAARKHGIDVSEENSKMAAILGTMRKAARKYVNRNIYKLSNDSILSLDSQLGLLNKGMYEVSSLAQSIQSLACLVYSIAAEQEWEMDDDSETPQMLAGNVEALTETLLQVVEEETRELNEEIKRHAHAA